MIRICHYQWHLNFPGLGMINDNFYIAGIGASAGGHQSLKEFFGSVPANSGISFCIITHLTRDHHSILDKILSRYTDMPVKRMCDSDLLEPNTVYVMPEGVKAYIKYGRVHLRERMPDEVINRTVDEFFYSLAEDQREKAIGIIFSGMGDDGARGVKLIHELGGIVLVQEPTSTPFKSMPENAIRWDHPDEILPPALLAKTVISQIRLKNIEVNKI
jgi:two-component system, chemotaxis family, protein-glutamate methylesterase/glutaminase